MLYKTKTKTIGKLQLMKKDDLINHALELQEDSRKFEQKLLLTEEKKEQITKLFELRHEDMAELITRIHKLEITIEVLKGM